MTINFDFKIFKPTLILGLLTLMAISLTIQWIDRVGTFTIINRVEHESTAQQYAQRYGLQLQSYSRFGVAVYETHRYSNYQRLLSTGQFYEEATMHVTGFDGGAITDDPYLASQYGLGITGIAESWEFTFGSPTITIAIIDTGIDLDHPDLVHALADTGFHAQSLQEGLMYADDDQGHGTKVAGVIAAAHNQLGIAGAAPQVKVMPIRASYENTSAFFTSDLINAMLFAIEQDVDIINMSLTTSSYHALFEQVCDEASAAGILVVAATGNSGKEQYLYPAAFPSVFAVGSISENLQPSFFSTYHDRVDALAPGHNIYTSVRGGYTDVTSGTSFAAPYASAIAALIWSVEDSLTVDELKTRLTSTAIDIGDVGVDSYSGYGLLNARRALAHLSHESSFSWNSYEIDFFMNPFPQITTPTTELAFGVLDWTLSVEGEDFWIENQTFTFIEGAFNSVSLRSELYQPLRSQRVGIVDVELTLSGLNALSEGQVRALVGPTVLSPSASWQGGTSPQTLRFSLNRMLLGHLELEFLNLTNGFHLHHLRVYSVGETTLQNVLSFAQAIEPLSTCDPRQSLDHLRADYANLSTHERAWLRTIWLDDIEVASAPYRTTNLVQAEAKWLMMDTLNP